MARITAFEAKTRFGELLERVAAGEEVITVVPWNSNDVPVMTCW